MCEKKRRHQKDEKRVQIGFLTFPIDFTSYAPKAKEDKTYEQFCDNPITMLL